MTKEKITELIDLIFDAVDASKVGPMFVDESGKKVGNTLAFNAFTAALQQMLPKATIPFEMVEKPEEWQE